jgi:uncharacterized membrane protein (DUF2068 family)
VLPGKFRNLDALRIIALLKFGKALLLLLAAVGTHILIQPAVASELYQWSTSLGDGYERELLQRLLQWLSGPGLGTMSTVEYLTIGYMALVLVEGVGLWRRKLWAEWLVVLAGAGLIPFELWKIAHPDGKTWMLVLALLVNVTVIAYLVTHLQRRNRRRRRERGASIGQQLRH